MKNKGIKKTKDKELKQIKKEKDKKDNKYSFIKVFNFILINAFRLVLIFLLVSAIIRGDKEAILLVFLSSITSFYKELVYLITKIRISIVMQIVFTTFIILAILFGTLMGVYDKIIWWDTILHGISGVLLVFAALMALAMMRNKNPELNYSVGLVISFSFFFAMTAGIIWELLEFSADTFLGLNAQRAKGVEYGVLDTMLDIVANTVGAFITSLGLFLYLRKLNKDEIHKFLEDWFLIPEKKEIRGKKILKKHKKKLKNMK